MTDANSTSDTVASTETDQDSNRLSVDEAGRIARRVVENTEQVIIGHHDAIEHLICALLGRGHVLLEDVPGVGKTMLARSIAQSLESEFKRIQFTPDLLPADITGTNVYNQESREFEFRSGPVFGNVVLGDEINRAPPKTQAALLEAMEEQTVTVDGSTHHVPNPFFVVATQNSVERDRTYELPAAELDRFQMKLELGYPTPEEESRVLANVVGDHPIDMLESVATVADLRAARQTTAEITVAEPVREYVTALANYTRERAQLGVSPRGSISLLRAAQARALLNGRDFVLPDDIQLEASSVLPHRIRTASGAQSAEKLVDAALTSVNVP
jgi:MoxR-like ATPase